eukprot:10306611-Alexandrium_andersonii.AAC.1
MSASLVGSEMCIRDSVRAVPLLPLQRQHRGLPGDVQRALCLRLGPSGEGFATWLRSFPGRDE